MKTKPNKNILILTAAITLAMSGNLLAQPKSKPLTPIPDQFIVLLKESAAKPVVKQQKKNNNRDLKVKDNQPARDQNLKKVKDLHAKHNVKETAVLTSFADVVVGFSAKLSKKEVDDLKGDPDVEGVYQDYEISLGPVQPEATAEAQAISAQAAAAQVVTCAVSNAGGSVDGSAKSTFIWILDTGINLSHPDLNVISSTTFAKSFISGQTVEDGHGHGTHCAGIAAAKNNTIGVVGVSAGAKVVPVKVLSNTGGSSGTSVISGLNHVAQHDIAGDVVNMSLGGYPVPLCDVVNIPMILAIRGLSDAGTFVCIAAGNDGDCNGATLTHPGCINAANVLTVSAINCNGTRGSVGTDVYANLGPSVVDWVAVGSSVFSTFKNGGFATLSGTSMATPVVAGVVHARGGFPGSSGNVTLCGATYRKASRTALIPGELAVGQSKTFNVSASNPYDLSGIFMSSGQTFSFTTASGEWNNGNRETTCDGYDGIPIADDSRRHLDIKMMALTGEIFEQNNSSSFTGHYFKIGCGPTTHKVTKSGFLICFANDTLLNGYSDNSRIVTLTVKRTQ